MLSNGFQINKGDKCVHVKLVENSCVVLCLYVDDILIFGSDMHVINDTKKFLKDYFDMNDHDPVVVVLGIKIIKDGDYIALTQSHYTEKLLKKFNYYYVSHLSTPLDPAISLKNNKGGRMSQYKYS